MRHYLTKSCSVTLSARVIGEGISDACEKSTLNVCRCFWKAPGKSWTACSKFQILRQVYRPWAGWTQGLMTRLLRKRQLRDRSRRFRLVGMTVANQSEKEMNRDLLLAFPKKFDAGSLNFGPRLGTWEKHRENHGRQVLRW